MTVDVEPLPLVAVARENTSFVSTTLSLLWSRFQMVLVAAGAMEEAGRIATSAWVYYYSQNHSRTTKGYRQTHAFAYRQTNPTPVRHPPNCGGTYHMRTLAALREIATFGTSVLFLRALGQRQTCGGRGKDHIPSTVE